MITITFILFSFISSAQTKSEEFRDAYPVMGWDSLKIIIENPENYPVIYIRAGFTGSIYVSLSIDSTGTLVSVDPATSYKYLSRPDSILYINLIPVVENILDSIKWYPSYKNNLPINDKIYRTFNFYLIDEKEKGFNIIAPKFYFNQKSY